MIRLFRVHLPTSVVALALSEIILLYFCFGLASILVLDVDPRFFFVEEGGFLRVSLVVLAVVLGLYFHDLYTNFRVRSRWLLIQQFLMVLGIAFMGQALVTYVNTELMLPRWIMIYGSALSLLLLPSWRIVYNKLVLRAKGTRLLMVGTSPVLQEIAARLEAAPERGFQTIGYVDDDADESSTLEGGKWLGRMAQLREIVASTQPDRIVVGMKERRQRLPVYELLDLRLSGIHIEEAASMYEAAFGRISIDELRPSQLVFSTELGPSAASVSLQGAYSFGLALIATLVLSPVMLIVALLVKMTSKGPALYGQTRVGMNDRPFVVYKFRSMYQDAEARTGAVWASKNDPRITPLGRWLRLFRLDELPQFINVLRGDMSIVGPRPERPEFVKMLSEKIPFYRQRHCVKPGITGWAQICYKYGDTIEDTITKLEYDLYYIKHISFGLDMYIMVNTLKTVLLWRGAQ